MDIFGLSAAWKCVCVCRLLNHFGPHVVAFDYQQRMVKEIDNGTIAKNAKLPRPSDFGLNQCLIVLTCCRMIGNVQCFECRNNYDPTKRKLESGNLPFYQLHVGITYTFRVRPTRYKNSTCPSYIILSNYANTASLVAHCVQHATTKSTEQNKPVGRHATLA